MTYQRSLLALLYFALALVLCVSACSPNESSGGGSDDANTGDDDTGGDDDDDDLVDDDGTSPPQSPSNLEGQADGLWAVDLTWQFNSGNEEGFNLQRKTEFESYATIATIDAGVTSYKDTGLDCETGYTYQILAFNDYGESQPSNEADVTTDGPCIIEPPSNLDASLNLIGMVMLSWEDNSNNETGYLVERQDADSRAWEEVASLAENTTNYTDVLLECETPLRTFEYRVRAFNDDVESEWTNISTGKAYCPVSAPTGLAVETIDETTVRLTWTNNATNHNKFKIYRDLVLIGNVEADVLEYTDDTLACDGTYVYTVTAKSGYVESLPTLPVNGRTLLCAPVFNTAVQNEVSSIEVDWTDNSGSEDGYELQRKTTEGEWETLATLAPDTTSYSDAAVVCNQEYIYRVRAALTLYDSYWSNEVLGEMVGCLIGDTCYIDETKNPGNQCEICRTDQNLSEWVDNDGAVCNDGVWCNGVDFCVANACTHHNGDPCAANKQCVEDGNICTIQGENLDLIAVHQYANVVALYPLDSEGKFSTARQLITDNDTEDLALGDFNEDSHTDIVRLSHDYNDTVDIMINDGTGNFSTVHSYIAGGYMVVDDFNNDNHLDVVLAGYNYFQALLGNGDGTLQPALTTEHEGYPYSLTAGDFNNDNNLDLAFGTDGMTVLYVHLGNGDGTFQEEAAEYYTDSGSSDVKAVDLNHDNNMDIVEIGHFNISVLLGHGDGTFDAALRTEYVGPGHMAFADFDVDGNIDMVVADHFAVDLYLGDGDGSFQAPLEISEEGGANGVLIEDINEDLNVDVIVVKGGFYEIYGNGDGTFQESIFNKFEDVETAVIADLNSDGILDVVFDGNASHDKVLNFLMGTDEGVFIPTPTIAVDEGPVSLEVGDFNNDANLDIALCHEDEDVISILLGNGDNTFQDYASYSVPAPKDLTVMDFDGDDYPDLAVVSDDDVAVFLNNGDGTFGENTIVASDIVNYPSIIADNVTGDEFADILVASTGSVALLPGNGDGTFGEKLVIGTGTSPNDIFLHDFNGDGYKDLMSPLMNVGKILIKLGNGDGAFGDNNRYNAGDTPYTAAVGNLNNDFALDVVTINGDGDGEFSVLFGNGDGTLQASVDYPLEATPKALKLIDLDADNDLDLVVIHQSINMISIHMGDGNGVFSDSTYYRSMQSPSAFFIGDFGRE